MRNIGSAYCERRVGLGSNPVEHFRPKKEAWRHVRDDGANVVDTGRYWWLTWTWENMLFACVTCNDGRHKANYFPLQAGTSPLPVPVVAPGATSLNASAFSLQNESPLLIDPASVDPLDHIEWRPINPTEPRRLWKWDPVHLTEVGRVTIKTLQLNELTDDVSDHIRRNLLARTEAICDLIDAGNVALAKSEWSRLGIDVASSASVHAAASWCALHLLVGDELREAASLPRCPRPKSTSD